MCVGSHLANREIYTIFLRLLTAFEFVPAENKSDWPVLDAIECNSIPTALTTEPKPFKVGFRIRNKANLDKWIKESDERTAHL